MNDKPLNIRVRVKGRAKNLLVAMKRMGEINSYADGLRRGLDLLEKDWSSKLRVSPLEEEGSIKN